MWPIRDFSVNIKLFNVRAGGQQFTNMEIVIEDKIKFRKSEGKISIPSVTQHFLTDNDVLQYCYKSESFRISKANPSSLVPWFCRL